MFAVGGFVAVDASVADVSVDAAPTSVLLQDFSNFGQRQREAGPTALAFVTLLRIVTRFKPDILIHENVPSFPPALLSCLQGYTIHSEIMDSIDSGFPVRRVRRYSLAMLDETVSLASPFATILESLKMPRPSPPVSIADIVSLGNFTETVASTPAQLERPPNRYYVMLLLLLLHIICCKLILAHA